MKSQTFSAHSIAAALMAADDAVEKVIPWQPSNDEVARYFRDYHQLCCEDVPKVPEIARDADLEKVSEMLANLKVKGVLDVLVKWLLAGDPEAITMRRDRDGFEFPGVSIDDAGFTYYSVPGYANTIACLKTQSDYQICMTVANEGLAGLALLEKATSLQNGLAYPNKAYSGVRFPMVDLRQNPDISFFVGTKAPIGSIPQMPMEDSIIVVTEATQENILRMDEVGARVRSETNMTMMLLGAHAAPAPPPPLIIDEPFLFWLTKPGCNLPLFAAYVMEDDWKKPESLEGD